MLPPGAYTRVAAYALLIDHERILLCRLSGDETHAGKWTLPGGGVDFGEHPDAAVAREVFEETGFRIVTRGIAQIESEVIRRPDGPTHAIKILYRAEVIGGTRTNEIKGSTDLCEWLTLEDCRCQPLLPIAELGVKLALLGARRQP